MLGLRREVGLPGIEDNQSALRNPEISLPGVRA